MLTDNPYSRRLFIRKVLSGTALATGLAAACRPAQSLAHVNGGLVGANAAVGHLMRNITTLPQPVRQEHIPVLIIGSGIAGLSARRWLDRAGVQGVMLIEMDDHLGGNAHHGQNSVSAYPWGAHYLPVPDARNTELIDFLRDSNVITGYDPDGLPVYNEYHLCLDPEERLYINGLWQEGIVPEAGVPAQDKAQFARFSKLIAGYKLATDSDGNDAFAIPISRSSADEEYRKLDAISFRQYLAAGGFTSKYLLWYLEYGCKDDFGCNLDTTSAWAGIHYFAARKGMGANTGHSGVLTWPEGNGFLMEQLKAGAASAIRSSCLAYSINMQDGKVAVNVYDVQRRESYTIVADKVLMASPQFVNKRLLAGMAAPARLAAYDAFRYAPWVVANITLAHMPRQNGYPWCWDNVIYGTASVGYVDANHQQLANSIKKVITFYLPLSGEEPELARKRAQGTTYASWLEIIAAELEHAHPGISQYIEHADVWVWGHGMIAPRPGFIWGAERRLAQQPINNRIFFAHSDLSGISVFEEAFYQGIRAAKEIMQV